MANTADTTIAGKIVEVTFTGTGADWNYSTDCGFDEMYVKSIIWHPSGAGDVLVVNEGGVDGPSIVHWQAYADLVVNGSFTVDKDPPDDWSVTQGTLTTEGSGQSGNCTKVLATGTPAQVYQDIAVVEGKKYVWGFYYKVTAPDVAEHRLHDLSNSATILAATELANTAGVWSGKQNYTFTAPAGCSSIRIYLRAQNDTDIVYFDTVTLNDLPINKQIDFGERGVPLKPYIDISDCTFSDITATKIIFILE